MQEPARSPVPPPGRSPVDIAWASLTVFVPVIVTLLASLRSVDLAYHVRAGELILDGGTIPRVDSFTFTVAGLPWLDQQWGAQVVLALAHRIGSWPTLSFLQATLVGVTFLFVYLACRARQASARVAASLTLVGFLVASPALGIRPQLLGLSIFGASLWIIAGRRLHPRRLWVMPLLAAVCANVHGATLLNPFGVNVWRYAWDLSTNPVIRHTISEWAPVTLSNVTGWMMIGSGLAVGALFARMSRPAARRSLLTLAAFFLLAMSTQRAIVWWALIAPVELAGVLAGRSARAREEVGDRPTEKVSALPAVALITALSTVVVLLLPWWPWSTHDQLSDAPQGLTAAVRTSLPSGSRVLAAQRWGSWFEFAVPDDPVFVDSRIEIVPAEVWDDYDQVGFSGAGWRDVLEKWQVDAVVAVANWKLIPYLRADPGWRVAYEDTDGVLFVRA